MNQEKRSKLLKVAIATVVVLGVMMMMASSYMYNNGLSGKLVNGVAKEGQIKVACIGDSITYGHGIKDWEACNYPAQLQELLGDDYHVANFGSSGACVNPEGDQPYVSRDVYKAAVQYDADIIVFMMGTNDSKPENWNGYDAFKEDYTELLESFLEGETAPEIIICTSAEAFFLEDADTSTGIAKYDIQPAIVDEIAKKIHDEVISGSVAGIVDIHTLTEAHPEWFEADGVHPNNDGAKAIAEAVAEAIRAQE